MQEKEIIVRGSRHLSYLGPKITVKTSETMYCLLHTHSLNGRQDLLVRSLSKQVQVVP
jgi:hypothetical protein